jgi:hypothetical protein
MSKFKGFDSNVEVAEKKPSSVFGPGLHTVKIVSVEEKNAVKSDPTWQCLWVKLEGTGGKQIYTTMLYPTESLAFQGKTDSYATQKFLKLLSALGLDSSPSNLVKTLAKNFENVQSLVGRELTVQIGNTGVHLSVKKDMFHVLDGKNQPVLSNGEPLIFSSRDAAIAHFKQAGVKLQTFTEVIDYSPSNTVAPTPIVKKAAQNSAFG